MIKLFSRKSLPTASSTLAIGAATVFVLATTAIGLFADHEDAPKAIGETWSLRGEVDGLPAPSPFGQHTKMSLLLK